MPVLLLSLASAVTAVAAAVCAWRLRRFVDKLLQRYGEAMALIAVIARGQPPLAHPVICRMCEEMLRTHEVTAHVASGPAADEGAIH